MSLWCCRECGALSAWNPTLTCNACARPLSFATIEPREDTLPACQVCGTRYRRLLDALNHGVGVCKP